MDKWSNMFLRNRAKTHKTDMHTCTYITLPSGAWMCGACFFIGRLRSLVVRALERYSKDPGSSPGGDVTLVVLYKQRKTLTSITICNAPFLFCVLPSLQNY